MSEFREQIWISPEYAERELLHRGYKPQSFSTISSSHEEVALSLIAESGETHDIIGLVQLLRLADNTEQQV